MECEASVKLGRFSPSASYIQASLLCGWSGRAWTFEFGLSRGSRVRQTSAREQRHFVATVAAAPVYDRIWPPSIRESSVLISEHLSSRALDAIWSNIDLFRALHRSGSWTVAPGQRRPVGNNSTRYLFRLAWDKVRSTCPNQSSFEELSSIK